MRKILVVARREFGAAVKTKTFLISLLLMPVLMGSSIVVQLLLKDVQDTRTQTYAVINRSGDPKFFTVIEEEIAEYNRKRVEDKLVLPEFEVKVKPLLDDSPGSVDHLREKLSEEVRKGDLAGFLEIGPKIAELLPPKPPDDYVLRYQSNRLTRQEFQKRAETAVTRKLREDRLTPRAGFKDVKMEDLLKPAPLVPKGLSRRNAQGILVDTGELSGLASILIPAGMMMLMFMVVMMVANPLLQGVIEEKMQRIAEVLLGSVPPFELMMGKLLGMTAVSLTISSVYLVGGYGAALHYRFAEYLPLDLLAWFLLFQCLAGLLFGSLFIAIGAACTDMKEAQNLLMPVMLLVCIPLFVLGSVVKEPNSAVVTWLSFFPFATPMLMLARQAAPPGIPIWQPLLGVVVVLLTTVLCVWAAGRIFRVGLLMQGKGARVGEMMRWVFKG
jgi:ABC-2 type transport system permease protein